VRERQARGLNAAVRLGLASASAGGAARALVLPADVPLVTAAELTTLLGNGDAGARATLVPARDEEGTNAMLLAPPTALAPMFGPGSYRRHLAQAQARRLDVGGVKLPGLARRIDQPRRPRRLPGPCP